MRYIHPKLGDTRIKKKFTFLPSTIDGVSSWLEHIYVKQEYRYGCDLGYDYDCTWADVEFVEKEDYIIYKYLKKSKLKETRK